MLTRLVIETAMIDLMVEVAMFSAPVLEYRHIIKHIDRLGLFTLLCGLSETRSSTCHGWT